MPLSPLVHTDASQKTQTQIINHITQTILRNGEEDREIKIMESNIQRFQFKNDENVKDGIQPWLRFNLS